MSKLSIGLVTSPSEESDQLIKLLEELGIEITYHISPDEIEPEHIQAENLSVWLLNVNDDDWHDNIDQLLDESEASIYFNEPGNLSKQSHPQYWCKNLVSRLYELTGIDESSQPALTQPVEQSENSSVENLQQQTHEDKPQGDSLTSALDELETNSVGIPSEIAADLVSELETISPELESSIEESTAIDESLKKVHQETISPVRESIEINDVVEPEFGVEDSEDGTQDESLADEDLEAMEQVNLEVEKVDAELENANLILDNDELLDEDLEPENEQITIESSGGLDASFESSPDEQIDLLEDFDSSALDDSELDFDDFEFESSEDDLVSEPLDNEFQSELIEPEEIESETADISDEIMQLAEDDSSVVDSDIGANEALDEFDLSAEVNPVLESVREANSKATGSVFELNDLESDSSQQNSELQNTIQDREEAIEFLSDFDTATNQSTDSAIAEESSSELELSLQDEPASPQDIHLELDSELDFAPEPELELALSEVDSQLEPEFESESETTSPDTEFDIGSLELESIDEDVQEKVTGKAVFFDEQEEVKELAPQQEQSDVSEEFEMPSDSGLSLESIGDEQAPSTGRAQFVIDDEIKESDKELVSAASKIKPSAQRVEVTESAEKNEHLESSLQLEEESFSELTLEAQETNHSSEINLESLEPEVEEPHSDLTITDDAAELSDGLMDLDHDLLDQSEPESFEIPMLDDAATGLDFEEPSQPVMQKPELCPCWVIGASLGGPAAVKRFLQSLPKDINASFIITQHIDENFLPVLAEILTTSSQFEVKVANGSNPMTVGQIYLAPLNGKTIFLQDGSMLVDRSQKWSEPYSPCIDDVIESLSSVYKEKSGAIIFSGMGQDGLNGAKKMKALGGQIWAQSVDTCANPSMPDAVISEQLTDVVASPEMLAEQLASYLAS